MCARVCVKGRVRVVLIRNIHRREGFEMHSRLSLSLSHLHLLAHTHYLSLPWRSNPIPKVMNSESSRVKEGRD